MKNPIAFLIVRQWDFLQKYILLPIWVVLKSQKKDIIVVCKSETSVKNRGGQVVIDMQNYLFSDAIAKVLKSYDSDFFIEMSDTPDKTAELCRVIQPHILMMEITGQALWSLKERLAICREVRRYAPNCKFIFTVDEKANAETAKKVVECKKTGLIDCFIYNTISSSYMTAVLDSL